MKLHKRQIKNLLPIFVFDVYIYIIQKIYKCIIRVSIMYEISNTILVQL